MRGGQGSEKGDRAEVNKALQEGFVGIVVGTEMAARRIDAPYLTHVINLDLPTDASHHYASVVQGDVGEEEGLEM